jgi:prepilin-type N-terminal cleavage/methylation domain-containing protein
MVAASRRLFPGSVHVLNILAHCLKNIFSVGSMARRLLDSYAIMRSLSTSPRIKTNSGFTMVELLIVIGVISVTLAIGLPVYHLSIKPTAHLNGAARHLQGDIQLARLRAISTNVRCGLDFDSPAGVDYVVFQDANEDLQYNAGETIVKRTQFSDDFGYTSVRFDTNYGGGDGVTFNTGAPNFIVNSFSISTRGLPWPNGSIYLKNNKDPAEGRRVVVNTMGRVYIEEY